MNSFVWTPDDIERMSVVPTPDPVMQLFSGEVINIEDMKSSKKLAKVWKPETIGHHLSLINRYTGASKFPYPVSQHSILVMGLLHLGSNHKRVQFAGLIHDAAEAFVNDLNGNLKRQPYMREYKELEKSIQTAIYEIHGLWFDEDIHMLIHDADMIARSIEATHLMDVSADEWQKHIAQYPIPEKIKIKIDEVDWKISKANWIEAYNMLLERI